MKLKNHVTTSCDEVGSNTLWRHHLPLHVPSFPVRVRFICSRTESLPDIKPSRLAVWRHTTAFFYTTKKKMTTIYTTSIAYSIYRDCMTVQNLIKLPVTNNYTGIIFNLNNSFEISLHFCEIPVCFILTWIHLCWEVRSPI